MRSAWSSDGTSRRLSLPVVLASLLVSGCASTTPAASPGDAGAGGDLGGRLDGAARDLIISRGTDLGVPPPDLAAADLPPPAPDLPPSGRAPGESCSSDGQCTSGKCLDLYAGNRFCVAPCQGPNDCAGFLDLFCEAQTPGSPVGWCVPRHPAHCASCVRDSDCGSLSERCTQVPGDLAPACHIDCALDPANACPGDYTCTPIVDAGLNRQLCVPNLQVCLDALGGYCDRVALPSPCARVNPAGTCTGQRRCLANGKRLDRCGALTPQWKGSCNAPDPAGCTLAVDPAVLSTKTDCGKCGNACGPGQDCCNQACTPLQTVQNCGACGKACANNQGCCSGACAALDTIQNCGACGVSCPGQTNSSDATCNAGVCGMTCRGDSYDVDKNVPNGCEVLDVVPPGHDPGTAKNLGSKPCDDGPSTTSFSANVPSDSRVHTAPPKGFSGNVGSAPDYWTVTATGGLFCVNDYDVTFTTGGGGNVACYRCTITNVKNPQSVTTTGAGSARMSAGSSSYNDGAQITFVVEKICNLPTQENVSYRVDFHL